MIFVIRLVTAVIQTGWVAVALIRAPRHNLIGQAWIGVAIGTAIVMWVYAYKSIQKD